MSFSSDTKEEICKIPAPSRQAFYAQLAAMLLFGKAFENENCVLQTEYREVADLMADALSEEYRLALHLYQTPHPRKQGQVIYRLLTSGKGVQAMISDQFLKRDASKEYDLPNNMQNMAAFLRGTFLVCGSMGDPKRGYHMEFVVPKYQLTDQLAYFLSFCCNLPVRYSLRKGHHVLYLKESASIEDLLTFMGATKASLEIMSIKVVKHVRNKVNRVANCETANIDKTVTASVKQVEAVKRIQQAEGLEVLPDRLRQVAVLRLKYPQMSLQELAAQMGNSVTRSGVYHRLEKIIQWAEKYRKENS